MHVVPVVFGLEFAREIHLGAGNVAVDVDAARHDHQTAGVEAPRLWRHIGDDLAARDADVADFAIHTIRRIVDPAIHDTQHAHRNPVSKSGGQ